MNKLSELEVCDFDWEIVIVFTLQWNIDKKSCFYDMYLFFHEWKKNQQYNFPNQKSEYRMHVIFFKCNAKETMIYGPNIVSIQFGKIYF